MITMDVEQRARIHNLYSRAKKHEHYRIALGLGQKIKEDYDHHYDELFNKWRKEIDKYKASEIFGSIASLAKLEEGLIIDLNLIITKLKQEVK